MVELKSPFIAKETTSERCPRGFRPLSRFRLGSPDQVTMRLHEFDPEIARPMLHRAPTLTSAGEPDNQEGHTTA